MTFPVMTLSDTFCVALIPYPTQSLIVFPEMTQPRTAPYPGVEYMMIEVFPQSTETLSATTQCCDPCGDEPDRYTSCRPHRTNWFPVITVRCARL
jgi:hypothetical protein